jgi:GNAT superfamily N-acetyltransferase
VIDTPTSPVAVRRLTAVTETEAAQLADLLVDCVDGGASVSFMSPLSVDRALDFWRKVARDVALSNRALLVAEDCTGIVGSVQLVLDQPENQPHRADLSKMLVLRRTRRRGIGALLIRAAESLARDLGKLLLVLDTASPEAERLYAALGWRRLGVIPGYALLPQGGLCDTTIFFRILDFGGAAGNRGR